VEKGDISLAWARKYKTSLVLICIETYNKISYNRSLASTAGYGSLSLLLKWRKSNTLGSYIIIHV